MKVLGKRPTMGAGKPLPQKGREAHSLFSVNSCQPALMLSTNPLSTALLVSPMALTTVGALELPRGRNL